MLADFGGLPLLLPVDLAEGVAFSLAADLRPDLAAGVRLAGDFSEGVFEAAALLPLRDVVDG